MVNQIDKKTKKIVNSFKSARLASISILNITGNETDKEIEERIHEAKLIYDLEISSDSQNHDVE